MFSITQRLAHHLTASVFWTTPGGDTVFFPFGLLHLGRSVASPSDRLRVERYLRREALVVLIGCALFAAVGFLANTVLGFALPAAFAATTWVLTRPLRRRLALSLPPSAFEPTFRAVLFKAALSIPLWLFYIALPVSILIALQSLILILASDHPVLSSLVFVAYLQVLFLLAILLRARLISQRPTTPEE